MSNLFDSARDKQQIEVGTHFYCHGCLVARPIEERSKKPDYCRVCYGVIENERKTYGPGDYWTDNGMVFVHYGKKYGVTAFGRTTCIGPLDDCQKEEEGFIRDTSEIKQQGVYSSATTNETDNSVSLPMLEQNETDKCIVCGLPVIGKRSDKRYCSSKCRLKHFRGRGKSKQLVMAGIK